MTTMTEQAPGYSAELEVLLQPIAGSRPTGESLRYAASYAQITQARLEDDPSLPLGDWERPLKKADWREVQKLCSEALVHRSKDLQIACWLAECWVRLNGISGLTAGAHLLSALLESFWDGVYPLADEDDLEPRAAPINWINTHLEQILLLHVPLYPLPDKSPPFLSLREWQQAMEAEYGGAARKDQEEVIGREDLLAYALPHLQLLAQMDTDIAEARQAWLELSSLLDEKFERDAPSVSRVVAMLGQMQQALRSLLHNRDPRQQPALAPVNFSTTDTVHSMDSSDFVESVAHAVELPPLPVVGASLAGIDSREQAYFLLEQIAQYLEKTEPHSPTPYLIKRAVTWGRLSLPELMQEVLREEGDLNRYFSMLGLRGE